MADVFKVAMVQRHIGIVYVNRREFFHVMDDVSQLALALLAHATINRYAFGYERCATITPRFSYIKVTCELLRHSFITQPPPRCSQRCMSAHMAREPPCLAALDITIISHNRIFFVAWFYVTSDRLLIISISLSDSSNSISSSRSCSSAARSSAARSSAARSSAARSSAALPCEIKNPAP